MEEAVIVMATEMNREILENVGLGNEETQKAGTNDLVIAIRCESEKVCETTLRLIEDKLSGGNEKTQERNAEYKTQAQALKDGVKANVAVISVPGRYAAREAKKALKQGLHVMMFSDNVTMEEELELKELAIEKGLLMMGPDCGTACLNGVGLCFANQVRKGTIGVVGASGTGLQEVLVQIDRLGGGIAQAIGTGGRDLKEKIGGLMMLQGIKALVEDESVKVIVLVSKPPEKAVEEKIFDLLREVKKPVVICFLEGEHKGGLPSNISFADTLYDAAAKAVFWETGLIPDSDCCSARGTESVSLQPSQKYIRGLFCGGTLCAESLMILREKIGNVKSNISHRVGEEVIRFDHVDANMLLDLGEDQFTNGRPHPMIEPSLRCEWILDAAKDPTVGVILMDFEIGYGSHEDPAGITADAIKDAVNYARQQGRELIFVGYICGTSQDKQDIKKQRETGVLLAESNVEAAELAARIIKKNEEVSK